MDLGAGITTWGYAAVAAGAIVEGETFLVLAGVAAQRGLLEPGGLVAMATAGAVASDAFFFGCGRRFGAAATQRLPRLALPAAGIARWVERYPRTCVIALRFLYGMRSVGPAVLGNSGMTWQRFIALDVIAAALWSTTWIAAGYAAGNALHDFRPWAVPVVAAAVALLVAGQRVVRKHMRLRDAARSGNEERSSRR